jgi:hypothetical protein
MSDFLDEFAWHAHRKGDVWLASLKFLVDSLHQNESIGDAHQGNESGVHEARRGSVVAAR